MPMTGLAEKGGIKFFSSPLLERAPGAVHGFLTRTGGASSPPFSSLNFSSRVGDDPGRVRQNREAFSRAFGIPGEKIFTPVQVHGESVFVLEGGGIKEAPEADAVLTAQKGVAIGVLTADCLPVLLLDPVKGAAGAVHAGRKGTALGISGKAVGEMRTRFGSSPRDIVAAIGPHIGPCCYSVGTEVYREFERGLGVEPDFFVERDGMLYLDLAMANVEALVSAGLHESGIETAGPCTSCRSDIFFSYRKEKETGRQLSFIMLA